MAKYTLKVDIPTMPKGEEVEVFPYGRVKNGDSIEVEATADEIAPYRDAEGIEVSGGGGGSKKKGEEGGES